MFSFKKTKIRIQPDQSVDFRDIDVIQFFDSLFDLWFIGTFVHNEDQRVIVFNFLHGRLSCQGELHNLEAIQPGKNQATRHDVQQQPTQPMPQELHCTDCECELHSKQSRSGSYLGLLGVDFLGYFGALGKCSVLGRLKWTEVRIFLLLLSRTPLSTFFLALRALARALPAPPASFVLTGFGAAASLGLAAAFVASANI